MTYQPAHRATRATIVDPNREAMHFVLFTLVASLFHLIVRSCLIDRALGSQCLPIRNSWSRRRAPAMLAGLLCVSVPPVVALGSERSAQPSDAVSAPSDAQAIAPFRYILLHEAVGHEAMCRGLRTLMNDPQLQPNCRNVNACRIEAIDRARHPNFELIPWESLPVSTGSRELRALSDYRATAGSPGRQTPGETWPDWYWRTQVKPEAEIAIANADLRILKATFDVNNDGTEETVLRYDDAVCNHDCGAWQAVVDPTTLEQRRDILGTLSPKIPVRFNGETMWISWQSAIPGDPDVPTHSAQTSSYLKAWKWDARMGTSTVSFVVKASCILAVMENQS